MIARALIAALLALSATASSAADSLTPEKRADIVRLIEMTGGSNIARQFADLASKQMFGMLKASRPEIPDRAIVIMQRELSALFTEKMAAPGGLTERVMPVYDKYFTHEELRDLLAFYATPSGKKAISVLPLVLQESMQIGQAWGQSLGPEIEKRILDALVRERILPPRKPAMGT